jgi:pyruvoyl-dependent arginine decarboxylase (PvlArgDC)
MREKANFPFKTTKISNSTVKEATTLLIEGAASSADQIQRWDHSVLKRDVNIVGVASILPRQFRERKSELSF